MPRKPRQPWEKVPHRFKWRCKICGQEFDSPYQAEKHLVEDCLPVRGCLRCGASLRGKHWQARYCGTSCRVMDYRDRQAGKPTRQEKRLARAEAAKAAGAVKATKAKAGLEADWCDTCGKQQPHRQLPDGYWVCTVCGKG